MVHKVSSDNDIMIEKKYKFIEFITLKVVNYQTLLLGDRTIRQTHKHKTCAVGEMTLKEKAMRVTLFDSRDIEHC